MVAKELADPPGIKESLSGEGLFGKDLPENFF